MGKVFEKYGLINMKTAVSPVIGTILMVAITVIIAAVIGAFVFGVPTNIQKAKFMASSIQLDTKEKMFYYHITVDRMTLPSTKIHYHCPKW